MQLFYYHWDGKRRATDDFFQRRNISYDFMDIEIIKHLQLLKNKKIPINTCPNYNILFTFT